jgi:hypothetical protein
MSSFRGLPLLISYQIKWDVPQVLQTRSAHILQIPKFSRTELLFVFLFLIIGYIRVFRVQILFIDDTYILWILLPIIAISADVLEKRRVKRMFAEREALNNDSMYSLFFANSGLSAPFVAELLREIAELLEISPGKLRPSDRFGHEIGMRIFVRSSDVLDALASIANRRAKKYNNSINLEDIKTIDEYVKRFAAIATSSTGLGGNLND